MTSYGSRYGGMGGGGYGSGMGMGMGMGGMGPMGGPPGELLVLCAYTLSVHMRRCLWHAVLPVCMVLTIIRPYDLMIDHMVLSKASCCWTSCCA